MNNAALATTAAFRRTLDVGFCLPQTTVKAGTAEQVSSITILPGQRLLVRWLTVHFIRFAAELAPPAKVNQALGAVYAGLYGDRGEKITAPAGQPLVYVPVELPGVVPASASYVLDLIPGTYSLLAANNLFCDAEISVSGTFRVIL